MSKVDACVRPETLRSLKRNSPKLLLRGRLNDVDAFAFV